MTGSTTIAVAPHPTGLREVRAELPRHLFQPNTARAISTLLLVAVQVAVASTVAYVVWERSWWFAAPLSWAIGSIAAGALFVAGHDCGHKSFLRSDRAMVILGHVLHTPVLYPFWAWKYSHDAHHRHTNLLDRLGEEPRGATYDNAWVPWSTERFDRPGARFRAVAALYATARWFPPLGSLLHLVWIHWIPSQFPKGRQRNRVLISMAVTTIVDGGIAAALLIGFGRPLAVLHFFVLPALGFQCWMALYTYLHHTTPDVTLHHSDTWTPFAAQMDGTVNVFTPRWLSFLHFSIDVHIPHHVSTNIPSYHLRAANDALRAGSWGGVIREHRLSARYLAAQVSSCHLWSDTTDGYVRFSAVRAE